MRNKALFIALFLSSCIKVGPDYERPCLDIPESYRFEEPESPASLNTRWWNQFEDPVLSSLIEEAILNNQDLQIASANIVSNIGILIQTESQLYPQLGYALSGSRFLQSKNLANPLPPLAMNPMPNYSAGGTLDWEIDFWGKIQRLAESAGATVWQSIDSRKQVLLTLVASVAGSYIQLRGLDEQLLIATSTLNAYSEELAYFSTQFQYGQTSEMSVAQAKTQVELAASAIPAIELQIAALENSLSVLLGSNPRAIPRGKKLLELAVPNVPSDIPSDILENRPDVRAAEDLLIANNALIGAAKALYFPSISLTANYGVASEALKNLFRQPSITWGYLGSLAGPILTWGGIEGQVLTAEARTEAALANYRLTLQQAFSDVETALSSHTYLGERVQAQKRLVDAASNYVRLAQLQYHGGYSPYFVVLQAQQQLFPAELSLVQTEAAFLTSLINIYQSMGGGWVNLADEISACASSSP